MFVLVFECLCECICVCSVRVYECVYEFENVCVHVSERLVECVSVSVCA